MYKLLAHDLIKYNDGNPVIIKNLHGQVLKF